MTKHPKPNKPGTGKKKILRQQAHSLLREQIFFNSFAFTQVLTLMIISCIEMLVIRERKMFLLKSAWGYLW